MYSSLYFVLALTALNYQFSTSQEHPNVFHAIPLPDPSAVPAPASVSQSANLCSASDTSTASTNEISANEAQTCIPIGRFTSFAHNLSTAQTFFLNKRQVLIKTVWYDGTGPAAYWIVSNSNKTLKERPKYLTSADYTNIRDETGSCGVLKAYKGQDVTLTLPENLNFTSLQFISMYCVQFDHNFGYIQIPDNIFLPDYTGNAPTECDPIQRTMSSLEILLIVLGVLAALGIVAAIAFTLYRKKQQSYNRH